MTHFDFSELEAFEQKLENVGAQFGRLGVRISKDSAERMAVDARRVHPWQSRTGKLVKDIRFIGSGMEGDGNAYAEFGVDSGRRGIVASALEYGWHHEGSGSKEGPFPFMFKAAERRLKQWVERIREAAVKVIVQ